jgi:hypothetical protein
LYNVHTIRDACRVFFERDWREMFDLIPKKMDNSVFFAKDVRKETIIND